MDVSFFFKSQAHYKVMQILALRSSPTHLRQICELSGLYVRSIELALKDLTKKKIVHRKKVDLKPVYSLNLAHPKAFLLISIFQLIQKERSGPSLDKKAQAVLAFSDSALNFFEKAKQK